MNTNDILDAIGEADDAAIERAKQPKRRSLAPIWITAGAAAACIALVAAIPAIRRELVPDTEEYHHLLGSYEESVESAMDIMEIEIDTIDCNIWYVENGALSGEVVTVDAMPECYFQAWKEYNGIGEEVRFISVKIEDNGYDSYSDDGMVVTHHTGDHFSYNLTVSKELESYYDSTDRALLLESLEKTMTGSYDFPIDEFHLILE